MSGAAADTSARKALRATPQPADRFRLLDGLSFVYFGVNTLLLAFPGRPANWPLLLAAHLLVLGGVPLAVKFSRVHPVIRFLREWYPVIGLVFMYTELRYLNGILGHDFHDRTVVGWERTLFLGHQPSIELRRLIPWKIVGEAVHAGYFSYYITVPTLLFALWLTGKRREFRISITVIAATYYFCYFWYIFFPVTGPYWQFRPFPDAAAEGWFFPQLANFVIRSGSSLGSAFPSSHIGASVAVVGLAARYQKTVFKVLLVPVILLCVGTVYGGFHYGVDALAGLLVGLLASGFGPGLVVKTDPTTAYNS